MLPRSGRAALRLPPAPLPPKGGLLPPAQPPPAAVAQPRQKSSPAPHRLPFVGVLAALPLPLFPPTGSTTSHRRTQRRLCPGPPLPARAANSPPGDPGEPQRGGLAALGPPHLRTRGHPTGHSRRVPQELAKPATGQRLGHPPASQRDPETVISSLALMIKAYNKRIKSTEVVLLFLTMSSALLSPPVLLSHVATNSYRGDSVHTFPRGRSEEDCPGAPHTILSPVFKDGVQHLALSSLWCLPQAPRPFRDDRERPHSDTSQPSQHPQTNPTRVD